MNLWLMLVVVADALRCVFVLCIEILDFIIIGHKP